MPRYFVTTLGGFRADDEDGIEVPNVADLERMLRRTLAAILHDEGKNGGPNEFWAEAKDASGQIVLRLKVALTKIAP